MVKVGCVRHIEIGCVIKGKEIWLGDRFCKKNKGNMPDKKREGCRTD